MARLGRKARPARLTWINAYDPFGNSLAAGAVQAIDVLLAAEVFQKFDSTIVKVLGSLSVSFGQVPVGTSTVDFGIMAYFYVADSNMPAGNMPLLDDPSTQAAYLWTYVHEARLHRVTDGTLVDTADDSLNFRVPIDIDAQRRFRENNKTLWFVVKNVGVGTFLWSNYIRTLVRIP